MHLPIIRYRKVWFAVSAILVVLSMVVALRFPPKLGIDFVGGSLMEIDFVSRPSIDEIKKALPEELAKESVIQTAGDKGAILRLPALDEAGHQKLLADLKAKFGDVHEDRFESVGPSIGGELRRKAVLSVSLVLIAIASYIAYAFRGVSGPVSSWKYGVTTLVVALAHDVIVPIGAFALLCLVSPSEINSGFVAAMLTILGFSVHDTIVVFDRIRENLKKGHPSFEAAVDASVNETIGRSINTSLTVLFPLLAIFFLGGESLHAFAFTLIVGLVAGTYSSIFLAAPILVEFERHSRRKR